ncbi:MAG: hypothetical protein ACE5JI_06350 [Acidobacteriota bacterium]
MVRRALKLAAWPAGISLLVTLARFFGERAALPTAVTFFIGIFWLTVVVGIYWGFHLVPEAQPYRLLFVSLLAFAWLSRIPVVIVWWITRTYGLGTHYDVFTSWSEAVVAQFGVGAAIQVITGGLLGSIVLAIRRRQQSAAA